MKRQAATTKVHVGDARQLETESGLSKREFFKKYGFVLLPHHTEMKAEDWLVGSVKPLADNESGAKFAEVRKHRQERSPLLDVYAKEIEPLVRELHPSAESEIYFPSSALRRGPGGPNNFYGLGVHQDFGLYPEDLKDVLMAPQSPTAFQDFMDKLASGTKAGYTAVNFWRPVLPMEGPVNAVPLAVLDPSTVNVDDIVPQDLYGFAHGSQHNMGIKFNENQKWYYYPDMTKDEVLVFRQFDWQCGVEAPYSRLHTVFHTAFHHPDAPKNAEPRSSSEYRLPIWLD